MYLDADDPRLTPISLRSELIAAGESDKSLARAIRTGAVERPRRGAYVDGATWRAMTTDERYAVRGRAAYRQARARVFLSHTSAVPLLGGPIWGFDLANVHLSRLDGRTGRKEAGIRQHSGGVAEGDVVVAYGMQLSSPLRATLEVTTMGSVEAGLVVANYFLHRRDFMPEQFRARYDGSVDRWPYSLKTDLVIRLADPRIESVGESRTMYFLWTRHFPRPEPQYEVYDDGVLLARLDFALPELGVWIEFDGRIKYQPRSDGGEDATAVVLREKRREERVAELTGWRCLRVTWADLENPHRLAARLHQLIEAVAKSRRAG